MKENPEDKAMREDGERYGAAHAPDFCAEYIADLVRLIETYSDADAEDQLATLRERFWARDWVPSAKQVKP